MTKNTLVYRRDIDGLRSVAVVPVVLGHAGIAGFSGGFVGVDIFFVISGFLITSILVKELASGNYSIVNFYERRARRILPALLLVLIAVMALGWFTMLPDAYTRLGQSVLAALGFVSNIWFWMAAGDYFGSAAEIEPLLHTWSLAVEEQFYILFPIYLWLVWKYAQRWLLALLIIPCLLSFGLSVWGSTANPTANFYLTPSRIWELGLGSVLAVGGFPAIRSKLTQEAIGAAGLVMVLGSIFLISPSTPFPGLAAFPVVFGTVLIIWSGGQTFTGRILSLPPLVWIGLISYSLYLWHWPVLVFSRFFSGSIHLAAETAIAAIVVTVALAWLSWRFVERPFRRKSVFSRKSIFLSSAIGGIAVASLAVTIAATRGYETRVDSVVLEAYRQDIQKSPRFQKCVNRTITDGLCALGRGDAETKSVLVWGDSHALVMLDGLHDWLEESNRSGLAAVKTACPPMWGVRRADLGIEHACGKFNRNVLEFATNNPEIETVILHARWSLAVEGTRIQGEPGTEAELQLASYAKEATEAQGNRELSQFGLEETVKRLRQAGKNVVIVGGIPEAGFSVPQALASSKAFGLPYPIAPTRKSFDVRNRRTNEIIMSITNEYNAIYISAAELMCDGTCMFSYKQHALYRDDDHLSVYGSKEIVPKIMSIGFAED